MLLFGLARLYNNLYNIVKLLSDDVGDAVA